MQASSARYEQDKKALEAEKAQTRQLNSQVQAFTKTESELRGQLNVYVEKFKQVSSTRVQAIPRSHKLRLALADSTQT